MKMNFSKAIRCGALALLLLGTHAFGAPIVWDTPVNVDVSSPSQVSTLGTLIGAESVNAGYLGGPDITIDTGSGLVTFTNSNKIAFFTNGVQNNGVLTGPNYQDILYSGSYVANTSAANAGNGISLTGLVVWHSYLIQLWTPYWTANFNTRLSYNIPSSATNAHATPESPSLVLGVGGVPPQYILGTFTADASSQTVYYYGDNGYGVFGAIQVRQTALPEPTTISLLALGALALIIRCRRRLAVC